MLVPFTAPNMPERHAYAVAVGIRCERMADLVYLATSEKGSHKYTVTLEDDRGECNCYAGWSGRACKHLAIVAAAEFPWLSAEWEADAELAETLRTLDEALEACRRARERRHELDCRAWRESVAAAVRAEEAETARVSRYVAEMRVLWRAEIEAYTLPAPVPAGAGAGF